MRKVIVVAVLSLLLVACETAEPESMILVSAAASLTDAFGEMEAAFESTQPDVDVVLNLGGSSSLREQILEGAPADVFASADTANMTQVESSGAAAGSTVFATNTLQIAVPEGNPAGVEDLADLGDPDLLLGLCAPQVPCGALALTVLGRAGVTAAPDTHEPDVRALLTKIQLRELDAGIVYASDVAAAGDTVQGVVIPDDVNEINEYPIAVLGSAPNPTDAEAFVQFVLSEPGRAILRSYGFGTPP